MLLLDDITRAPSLPCIWLIATGEAARTRPERSQLRHAITRQILSLHTGVPVEAIDIGHDRAGRPLIEGPAASAGHISHAVREGFVAVAFSDAPIGVDVERVGAGPIPLQALHRAEQLWLNQTPEAERARAFAALWAAKEAYGKWAGTGLVEPDRLAILPNSAGGWSPAGAADAHIETRLVTRDGVELVLAVATAA